MNKSIYIVLSVITIGLVAYAFNNEDCSSSRLLTSSNRRDSVVNFFYKYLPVKDTIYITGNRYILLSLKSQTATLVRKNDSSLVFRVSSGTDRVPKGLNTPTGIFTVQSKSPIATSKQFDNCELFNWIGFNGNIGFHGLKGTGYYRSLGFRPSSHGCVRMSNEEGLVLYKNVSKGTPVFVFDDEPARIPAFIDIKKLKINNDYLITELNSSTRKMLANRLKNLYSGKAVLNTKYKIILDGNNVLRPGGIEIGDFELIKGKQELPIADIEQLTFKKDNISTFQITLKDTLSKAAKPN